MEKRKRERQKLGGCLQLRKRGGNEASEGLRENHQRSEENQEFCCRKAKGETFPKEGMANHSYEENHR